MNEDSSFELSKAEVRGKRSNKGATKKKFVKKMYDEDVQEHSRKQAGKKGHSRFHEEPTWVLDEDEYAGDPYEDIIDPRMIK